MQAEELITDLIERTKEVMNAAEGFKDLGLNILNWKENPEKWSVLECLEHLNLYGDFYIPEMDKRMAASSKAPAEKFKTGLLGNYFAKSMLPREKLNTMKTFKDKNPAGSLLGIETLDRFLNQQKQILELLQKARNANLNKVKTGITISNIIKLKIGDTFRVVIYHNQRHIVQAQAAIAAAKNA